MRILEVLSKDTVTAQDSRNEEIILYGNSLGEKQFIKPAEIERILKTPDREEFKHLKSLIENNSESDFQTANQLVSVCELELERHFDFGLYLKLVDHILFALKRLSEGIKLNNKLLNDIKAYYPDTYKASLRAVKSVRKPDIPDDEAGYIALHIAHTPTESKVSIDEAITAITGLSIKAVEFINRVKIDRESITGRRFIRHLRRCLERAFKKEMLCEEDEVFFGLIKKQYGKPYLTALKIANYLYSQYDLLLTDDEVINLTIHINQLIELSKIKS